MINSKYRESYTTVLKEFCHFAKDTHFIELTEWSNGEGFDVTLSTVMGNQLFTMTWGEFDALKTIVDEVYNE